MKKLMFLLSVCLLLTACASAPGPEEVILPAEEQPTCGPGVPYGMVCRIVDGAEEGELLLAEADSDAPAVYTLSLTEDIRHLPEEPLRNGHLLHITYRSVLETYPAQLADVSDISIVDGGFDDRCALYLGVLEDLWEVDPGLNDGVEFIGMDLSQTGLTPAEQAAVSWAFAGNHGAELVEGTVEDLVEQGWITATPLSTCGSGQDFNEPEHYFYEWEAGCHYSITEQPVDGSYSLVPVTFDARKWRSSLGAYYFCDCTAVQSALGEWSDYEIRSEAIS